MLGAVFYYPLLLRTRSGSVRKLTPWCLGGNGGMDPYSSPYIIPKNNPYVPFPHSLLSTKELKRGVFFAFDTGICLFLI